jgi:hypothetical protein
MIIRYDATFAVQSGTYASVGKRRVKVSSCVLTVTGMSLACTPVSASATVPFFVWCRETRPASSGAKGFGRGKA